MNIENEAPSILKNELSSTWFARGVIDFERKIYELLSYLRDVKRNVENGFFFPDYYELEKRYKDLESYIESSEIVYAKKEDKELLEYIYDLPQNSEEITEINQIVYIAHTLIGNLYYEIKNQIQYIIANMKVFNKISNRRFSPVYFIEKNDSYIVEKYKVGKSKVESLGAVHISSYNFLHDEENYVHILSDLVVDTESTLIPIVKKLIESGDCS